MVSSGESPNGGWQYVNEELEVQDPMTSTRTSQKETKITEMEVDPVRIANIHLQKFFEGDDPNINTLQNMCEGMQEPRTFGRILSEVLEDFYEDEGVLIVLGEEEGKYEVIAYEDNNFSLVKDTWLWDRYHFMLEDSSGLESGFEIVDEMPAFIRGFSIDYIPDGGKVIGPGTSGFYDDLSRDLVTNWQTYI